MTLQRIYICTWFEVDQVGYWCVLKSDRVLHLLTWYQRKTRKWIFETGDDDIHSFIKILLTPYIENRTVRFDKSIECKCLSSLKKYIMSESFTILKYEFRKKSQVSNYFSEYICWPTVVEGDLKAPFSIATTTRCKGGHYSFLLIAPLILDPYLIMLRVNYFLSHWYTSTYDWFLVFQKSPEHSAFNANWQVKKK